MGNGVRTTPLAPGRIRLIGSGQMLPKALEQPIEAFFGADFSTVRVHHSPVAEAIGALAFTLGEDICFAPGRYDPHSADGLELLGHELTHVLQQREGRVSNPGPSVAVVQDPYLEAEADHMGRKLAAHLSGRARGVLRAADRAAGPGGADAISQAPGRGSLRRPDTAQPMRIGKWWSNRSLPTKLTIGGIGLGLGLYLGYKAISGVSGWFAEEGVRTVPFDHEIPEALEDLCDCKAAEDAEKILARSMSKSIAENVVDNMSSYSNTKGPKRLSNWLSAGSRQEGPLSGFRVPSKKTVESFFVALFDAVREGTRSEYNRSDLFHGHINYWNGDVVIIFHAKEYPDDVLDTKYPSNNAEEDEPGTQFQRDHVNFRYRNALYSFKRNAIDFIDLQAINNNDTYYNLINQGITLDQTKLGDSVAGLNYLPKECDRIILH